jgi:hypothetical protein
MANKQSLNYRGYKFVRIDGDETRDCTRMMTTGYKTTAFVQKNGNIGVIGLSLGSTHSSKIMPSLAERLSYILYRLKLIDRREWEKDHTINDLAEYKDKFQACAYEAEQLGYRLVQLKPAKKVPS